MGESAGSHDRRSSAPRISIAMATCNGGRFLRQQLESFAAQSRPPDELVVSDDCSADDTVAVVESFAAKAAFRVELRRNQERLGYAANFSRALSMATGDLVFLSDQDDVWYPEKLAVVEQAFRDHPRTMLLMNDAEFTDAELRPSGVTKLRQIRAARLPDAHFVMGCCQAIRREFLTLLLPVPPTENAHDGWLVSMADGLRARHIMPDVLQAYRRHGANVSERFVNTAGRVTPWTAWRHRWWRAIGGYLARRPAGQEERRAAVVLDLLNAHGNALASLVGAEAVSAFVAETSIALDVAKTRRAIRASAGRLGRLPLIWKLWRRGGYANSAGVASMLKDWIDRDTSAVT